MNIDIIYITSEMNVAIFQGISLCQRWKKIGSRDISWLRFRLTVLLDPVPEKRQAVWQDSLLQMSGWWMVMSLTSSSEYWGNMTDDKVVLKKFPTSSISIWERLPCWLMFFGLKPEIFESEKRSFENCRFGSFVLWATNLIQQRIPSKASKMGPKMGHVRLNQLGPSSDCKNFW